MLIMLAPITRETPAAIEKNAVAEEMSRMRGRGLEAHYSTSRTLQAFVVTFRNNTLAGSQHALALSSLVDLRKSLFAKIPLHFIW